MVDADGPAARHLHLLLPDPPVHARVVPDHHRLSGKDGPALAALRLGDAAERWRALGFAVDADGRCRIGSVELLLEAAPEPGIAAWALRGVEPGALGELPTDRPPDEAEPVASGAAGHPNGALVIDHVVARTPDLARTVAALERTGLECRRLREAGPELRQAFFVAGESLLEVVGPPEPEGDGPACFWGLTVSVADLDAAAAALGDRLGPIRGAVQPGRRIATVPPTAGPGAPLALMTPRRL